MKNQISVERQYLPVPVLLHASYCLSEIRAAEGKGSYYGDLGALVLLAFAVEGFCQTYGPELFGNDWEDAFGLDGKRSKKGIESDPVEVKLKKIAKKANVVVDYGKQPWSDIRRLLKERDTLAHPRPISKNAQGFIDLDDGEHPLDQATQLVLVSWEELIKSPDTLPALRTVIIETLQKILEGLKKERFELLAQGSHFYRMNPAV